MIFNYHNTCFFFIHIAKIKEKRRQTMDGGPQATICMLPSHDSRLTAHEIFVLLAAKKYI
jgi:glycyl-tRNA synthetase alpha subunit